MRQDFHATLRLPADAGAVWEVVGDVPTVLSWISIVETIGESDSGYTVVLADRLGPFKLRADLAVAVEERVEGRLIRAHGDGEDRQIGSRLVVDVALALEQQGPETQLDVSGSYEVTGRPAALGAGSIRKKATAVLAEFFSAAERSVGAAAPSGPA
ncbi:MAG TPA: SRPBCC domain-containing protein [Gaiellaceae bacterium]|nr:SRPBCC domain-containing protein [Gaiellaceae bacterium]